MNQDYHLGLGSTVTRTKSGESKPESGQPHQICNICKEKYLPIAITKMSKN